MAEQLSFTVFADLHYKTGMYAPQVSDLQTVLSRAERDRSAFVLHCGDLCNDYQGSPVLWKAWLDNPQGLSVYGIYGNHELETKGNSMPLVTPKLTNAPVMWGTADGGIGDGTVGYYYFDRDGFRIICLDTNYSFNSASGVWEHNPPGSWGPAAGNKYCSSLGDTQLQWFRERLFDAAEQGLSCIVVGHDGFSGRWDTSPDGETVRELYRQVNQKKPHTVLLSVNGHMHTDHIARIDDVVYFDVNAAINGCWLPERSAHYLPEHTFLQTEYDEEGVPITTREVSLNTLSMHENTWFFTEPLSTAVTVTKDGGVTVAGMKTAWCYGVVPSDENASAQITTAAFRLSV